MKQPRILVTGSSTFFATRLIHDLGRRGVDITAADSLRYSAGKSSRFVSRGLRVPTLGTDPGPYLEAILAELKLREYDLLLPTFEESLLFSEYEADIRPYTRLFLPEFSAMQTLHHKPSLHALCQELGLPTPPTLTIRSADSLQAVADQIGFPVVLKLPSANNAVGFSYCEDFESLNRDFQQVSSQQDLRSKEWPFVQKKIEGNLVCSLCFGYQGRKLAEVVYRTSRTFPQAGGTAAHRESIQHPLVSNISDRLIEETKWSGFIGFDFLVEHQTGIPYVIDANPRSTPAINLGFLCGLDWSQLILDLIAEKVPAPREPKIGIHAHTLLLDVSWLLEGLLPRTGSLWNFPRRCAEFLAPPWKVHSMDDLCSIGEVRSALVATVQAVSCFGRSILAKRTPREVLLEDVNYNSRSAEQYRLSRQNALIADDRNAIISAT